MSVDIAKLVFEFDSSGALDAEKAIDRATAAADRWDAATRKTKTATQLAGVEMEKNAQAGRAVAKSATELAASQGVVEKATRSSIGTASELRALRALDARQMKELAAQEKAAAADQAAAAKAAASERAAAEKAAAAAAKAASAEIRASRALDAKAMREMVVASRAYERDQAAAAKALEAQIASAMAGHERLNGGLIRNVGVSRAATQAGLNLSRQAADIGVQFAAAATSAHPLQMILMSITQQGPQIADALTTAKTQGVGFSDAMKSLGVMLGLVRTTLPPLIAAELELATAQQGTAATALEVAVASRAKMAGTAQAAAADEAAAVAATELAAANQVVATTAARAAAAETVALAPLAVVLGVIAGALAIATAGFGLFEREIDKNTKYATTWGDTWKATVKVVGDIIMDGPIGTALRWLGGFFGKTLDAIVDGVMWFADKIVGHFGAAFQMIVKYWYRLPEVFGVIVQGAANITIDAVEGMINTVLKGVNYILKAAGKATLDPIDLPKVKLANAKLAAEYDKLAGDISSSFKKGREGIADRIAAQADKEYLARQKVKKASKDAADQAETDAQRAARATAAYIAGLEDEISKIGLTDQALRRLAASREIESALKQGDLRSAERIHQLVLEREAMLDLAQGLREAAEARVEFNKANAQPVVFENTPGKLATDAGKIDSTGIDKLGEMDAELEKVARRWREVEDGADQLYYSLRNNDWLGATQGLVKAIRGIKAAFDAAAASGGNMAGYLAAGGTIASAAGPLVGGKGGRVLTGIGSGIATGAAIGSVVPVIGTAIGGLVGGILGGLGGLFGGGSGKKKAQREAAERAAAAEADRLARVAEEHRSLEIKLMEMQGKSAEALAARRADELAKMDESNRALQQQVYALEDQAAATMKATEAASAAAAVAAERRGLDIRLMEATGNASGALAARRADEIAALDESNRALLALVFAAEDAAKAQETAKSNVLDAYNTFADAKRAEIDALRQTEQALKAFRKDLDFGAIAGRGPVSQLAATRREFERLSALGAADPERVANLQAVGSAFIEASKIASPTELAFQRDIASVRRATEASLTAVGQQADIAQQQLDAATAQLAALGLLNTTTLDLATTIKAYLGATGGLGAANDNAVDFARYATANPDLRANWDQGGIMRSLGPTFEEALRAQYQTFGRDEIAQGLRTYATGGSHPGGMRLVGEEGPELEVTGPSRIYSARDTARMMGGDTSDLVAEIRGLRAEVADLKRSSAQTATATRSMDARGRTQELTGVHVRGETPGDPVITSEAA